MQYAIQIKCVKNVKEYCLTDIRYIPCLATPQATLSKAWIIIPIHHVVNLMYPTYCFIIIHNLETYSLPYCKHQGLHQN
jgi:hypothetical protein